MVGSKPLQRFVDRAPVCVMVRLAMERAMGPEALDALFRATAVRQYERDLLFSTLVGLMLPVVCGGRRSVHEAYRLGSVDPPPGVSIASVYNKLNGVEPDVSAALVRHTAAVLGPLVRLLASSTSTSSSSAWPDGYAVRVVDGNHLAGSEHRIAELRHTKSAALPGQALAVLDPAARLIVDVVPCADAHAHERTLLGRLLPRVRAGELWVADRGFCTTRMLFGVARAGACFLVRFHARSLAWRELGPFRPRGRAGTGTVAEQAVEVRDPLGGGRMTVRRVRLALDEPTDDGETQILLLTNLPADDVPAARAADAYRGRWTIEHAFGELTVTLRGEVATLGYPGAALFAFCVAAAAYNLVALVMAALGAAHDDSDGPHDNDDDDDDGGPVRARVSGHHLAREWATVYPGMAIAVGPRVWSAYRGLGDAAFAAVLRDLAAGADLRRYRKARRGPKKRRPPRTSGARVHHVATARLLARRHTAAATGP